jgi:hypothetical protein
MRDGTTDAGCSISLRVVVPNEIEVKRTHELKQIWLQALFPLFLVLTILQQMISIGFYVS